MLPGLPSGWIRRCGMHLIKADLLNPYRRKSGRVDVVSHWPVCFYGLVQLRDGNSSVQDFALDAAKAVRGLL